MIRVYCLNTIWVSLMPNVILLWSYIFLKFKLLTNGKVVHLGNPVNWNLIGNILNLGKSCQDLDMVFGMKISRYVRTCKISAWVSRNNIWKVSCWKLPLIPFTFIFLLWILRRVLFSFLGKRFEQRSEKMRSVIKIYQDFVKRCQEIFLV